MKQYDAIIIGGGPAGLTALLYLGRGMANTVLLEAGCVGGQMLITDAIENYPGFPGGIQAFTLTEQMEKQAREFGGAIETLEVASIENIDTPVKKVVCATGETFETKVLILTPGAKARDLGVAGEEHFKARGVSYCGTCDGAFFRDKTIAVVGGGDTAFDETVFLTRFAKKIYLVHRRKEFRAAPISIDRVRKMEKVEFVLDTVIDEIYGEQTVKGIRTRNTVSGTTGDIPLDGVFIFVGLDPVTGFLAKSGITMTQSGYIIVDRDMKTNFPGVYAAGDVIEKSERQIATAVGDAATAACQAIKYLDSLR